VSSTRPLRLLHITDTHLFEDESEELYGVVTGASFRAVIGQALAEVNGRIDAVLATGDIAEDGRRGTYERFRSQVLPFGVPVLCVPGNHEDPAILAKVIDIPPLQYCGSLQLPGWRVVMLDSHVPDKPGGWLVDSELARLEQELAASAGQHVLVCMHHQPIPIGSPWLDAVGLDNAAAFEAIVSRHDNVRAVLWGHVHQASDRMHRGIRMMSTPSTCAQFTPHTQRCIMDLEPPGYRWLELAADGSINTHVVWLEAWRRTERPPDSRQAAS
jgi:3',5'-cyclic-AMP phosphodiesterase